MVPDQRQSWVSVKSGQEDLEDNGKKKKEEEKGRKRRPESLDQVDPFYTFPEPPK
jgi:hypothetical protein